jgi:hypothetical protein
MACGTKVIWDPTPVGSIFKAQANGDESTFDVEITVSVDGEDKLPIEHDEIVPGPSDGVKIDAAGQFWTFRPTLKLFSKPPKPVMLETWLEDENGNVVKIAGNDAKCRWKVEDPAGPTLRIKISVNS